jgi:hypothetical protein
VNGSKYESVAILAIANAKARIILSSFHSSRAKRNAHAKTVHPENPLQAVRIPLASAKRMLFKIKK